MNTNLTTAANYLREALNELGRAEVSVPKLTPELARLTQDAEALWLRVRRAAEGSPSVPQTDAVIVAGVARTVIHLPVSITVDLAKAVEWSGGFHSIEAKVAADVVEVLEGANLPYTVNRFYPGTEEPTLGPIQVG